MKYFFDNCISHRYARMLAAIVEYEVVALIEKFPPDVPDAVFLPQLRHEGFVYVTTDRHQKSREREARAIKEANITALWFGPFWSRMGFWDQAAWIITRWPKIDGYVRGVATGTCAEVKQNGTSQPFNL